jgi:hypothetical protein
MKGTSFGDVKHIKNMRQETQTAFRKYTSKNVSKCGIRKGTSALETNGNSFERNELSAL